MGAESRFTDPPGEKARAFIEALDALCGQHGVQLTTSDYDGLQVWDLAQQRELVYCNGIEDKTAEGAVALASAMASRDASRKALTIEHLQRELDRCQALEFSASTKNVTGLDTFACPDCGAGKGPGSDGKHRWECELAAKIRRLQESLAKEQGE